MKFNKIYDIKFNIYKTITKYDALPNFT